MGLFLHSRLDTSRVVRVAALLLAFMTRGASGKLDGGAPTGNIATTGHVFLESITSD